MSDVMHAPSEFILYQTEDGRTRIQCRFENETIWLSQIQLAELFQTTKQNMASLGLHFGSVEPQLVKKFGRLRQFSVRAVRRKVLSRH